MKYQKESTWRRISNALIDALIFHLPRFQRSKTLLLVRLDAIGDYVLFRNFIQAVVESERFKDYRITLCGNVDWRELAETLDGRHIDRFIWIKRRLFKKNTFYKLWKMIALAVAGFEVAIESRYSREYHYGEQVIKAARARESIGSVGDLGNITAEQKRAADTFYTKLIPATEKIIFEFDRNKEFFEQLLQQPLSVNKPVIHYDQPFSLKTFKRPYVVFFPGGSGIHKQWSHTHMARLADRVSFEYGMGVVIAGGPGEEELAQLMLMYSYYRDRSDNFSGQTSLLDLFSLIREATALISMETCAVHFAAAANTPAICVANGNNIFRFTHYPEHSGADIDYIYPPCIQERLTERDTLAEKYKHDTHGDIHEIRYEDVERVMEKKLKALGFSLQQKSWIL